MMASKRSVWLTTVAVLVIFCIMSVVVYQSSFLTRSRSSYQAYNLEAPSFSRFAQIYLSAQASSQSWTADPRQVALRVLGYPENTAISLEGMKILPARKRHFTALIAAAGPSDGSVAAREHRVDLVQKDERWEIEWVGERWSCLPGHGHQDLSTEPCS